MSRAVDEEVRRELVALLQREHDAANAFIGRLITLRTAIASLAGTLWAASVGVALAAEEPLGFLAAGLLTTVLLVMDMNYAAHYRSLRAQVRRLEQALDANYKYVLRWAGKEASARQLERAFMRVEIGQVAPLRPLRERTRAPGVARSVRRRLQPVRSLWVARDLRTWLLLVLVIGSVVLWMLGQREAGGRVCFEPEPESIVMVDELPEVIEGSVQVIPCP